MWWSMFGAVIAVLLCRIYGIYASEGLHKLWLWHAGMPSDCTANVIIP